MADFSAAPEVAFVAKASTAYTDALRPVVPTSFKGSADVALMIAGIAAQMNPPRSLENGGVSITLRDPYLPGTLMGQLRALQQQGDFYMIVETDVIAIWPKGGVRKGAVPLIPPRRAWSATRRSPALASRSRPCSIRRSSSAARSRSTASRAAQVIGRRSPSSTILRQSLQPESGSRTWNAASSTNLSRSRPMAEDQAYQGAMDLHSGGSPLNAMDFVVRQVLGTMATATVVLVKAVDAAAETVDVQPLVHQIDGHRNVVPHGIIHGLPYVRLQGGSCAVIIDPRPGNIGLAVFASSDISTAQANKAPSPPGSLRRFNWSDGVYIGGLLNGELTDFIRFPPGGGVEMIGTGQVTMKGDTVTIDAETVSTTGALKAGTGWTGTIKSGDERVMTFVSGVLTGVV